MCCIICVYIHAYITNVHVCITHVSVHICIYMIPARGPYTRFEATMRLPPASKSFDFIPFGLIGPTSSNSLDFIACFGPTRDYIGPTLPASKSLDSIALGLLGPTSGLPYQRANHWISLLCANSGLPRAYLANEQIGFHCFWPTRAYLGPTLPKSTSLDCIASGLLEHTSGLSCQRVNHWISLIRVYSGLPRAHLANEQIIGFRCFGFTRAYLRPTLPMSKSLDFTFSGLLGHTSGLPCQSAYFFEKLDYEVNSIETK